jgi:hypothetical protein
MSHRSRAAAARTLSFYCQRPTMGRSAIVENSSADSARPPTAFFLKFVFRDTIERISLFSAESKPSRSDAASPMFSDS